MKSKYKKYGQDCKPSMDRNRSFGCSWYTGSSLVSRERSNDKWIEITTIVESEAPFGCGRSP